MYFAPLGKMLRHERVAVAMPAPLEAEEHVTSTTPEVTRKSQTRWRSDYISKGNGNGKCKDKGRQRVPRVQQKGHFARW